MKTTMAKVKSPLKSVRTELDLSRSELASLVFHNRDSYTEKAQLAQAISRCEAGLLDPDEEPALMFLFDLLSKQGYKALKKDQEVWIDERKTKIEAL